ncbi:hypothetical protein COU62_02755 [Candidatus Pacearchaeota archaeon CG10_big_fil_rev_8_21_14_0_10_35_219]|nr:hypothetical protein [Candidatus Pacearchaeota archaeon]OIO43311.1 MAG: hypothetical protein AUJ63_00250 [Candidatus Pacearchaeota archaeon CG1_02_35_32]PIO07759.1 MAG: hypothetical protein COU62_02755 [Candidatus Pacearchaeota archaeon CG10_big_fil_rev_8_21_14_0_10_35_219]PIY81459.1 MAG: hypothetical protein COY79_01830 [Candidatus Pacearchaeota archaeon CG_4_10_14_0_8_um_filter_35_169]PIZ80455.1 MAG: hypothetical protein COY00_01290 [Candidatus Pacearchaeota archaeon CG_4_10_14_0_2_um_filt
MQIKERSKHEIELKLKGMGDYVRMDYLQRAMRSSIDFDTKKFVQIRLAKIYESRNMFKEAAKLIKNSADINTTYRGKIQDYMKSAELFIRGGGFDEADTVFKFALACGNSKEKEEMKNGLKNYYQNQAEYYMKRDKRNQAKKTYEKMMTLSLNDDEKKEIRGKLLNLYQALGLIKEYQNLKKY